MLLFPAHFRYKLKLNDRDISLLSYKFYSISYNILIEEAQSKVNVKIVIIYLIGGLSLIK